MWEITGTLMIKKLWAEHWSGQKQGWRSNWENTTAINWYFRHLKMDLTAASRFLYSTSVMNKAPFAPLSRKSHPMYIKKSSLQPGLSGTVQPTPNINPLIVLKSDRNLDQVNVTSSRLQHDAQPLQWGGTLTPSYYLSQAKKVCEVYLARRLLPFGFALLPLDRRRLPLTLLAVPLFHFPPKTSVTNWACQKTIHHCPASHPPLPSVPSSSVSSSFFLLLSPLWDSLLFSSSCFPHH